MTYSSVSLFALFKRSILARKGLPLPIIKMALHSTPGGGDGVDLHISSECLNPESGGSFGCSSPVFVVFIFFLLEGGSAQASGGVRE